MGIRELVIHKAEQKGILSAKSEIVKSLLTQTELNIPEIAKIVDVTEAFVQNIINTQN